MSKPMSTLGGSSSRSVAEGSSGLLVTDQALSFGLRDEAIFDDLEALAKPSRLALDVGGLWLRVVGRQHDPRYLVESEALVHPQYEDHSVFFGERVAKRGEARFHFGAEVLRSLGADILGDRRDGRALRKRVLSMPSVTSMTCNDARSSCE